MQICKTVTFDAAHRLDKLPANHKCFNLHGHTYRVDIIIKGEPNELGWIVDYADIAKAWEPLHKLLDHQYLNSVDGLSVPTTEILALWIYSRLGRLLVGPPNTSEPWKESMFRLEKVRVYESSSTYCEAP